MTSQYGLDLTHIRPDFASEHFCSVEELRVFKELRWGAPNARQVGELAQAAGVAQRRLQTILDHLTFRHFVPVGTSMGARLPDGRPGPCGNYLIDSAAELEATRRLFRRRGLHSLARDASLGRESLRRHLERVQTELLEEFLEELP